MSSPRREDDGEDNRRHGSLAQEINAIIDNIENEEDINDGDIFDAVDADEAEEPADNNEEAEDDDDVLIVEAEPILSTTRDIAAIFRMWESTHSRHGFDPVPILTRLAELIEEETELFMRKDPDPFDERHPSRTDPECELGRILKLMFRKDNFMTRLVDDYLRDNFFTRQTLSRSSFDLNVAACRLVLVIMPGLDTSAVFQAEFDNLITRLYGWAENAAEPLCSYATGLLAAAMEVQDMAVGFREQNNRLITLMLRRLHTLQQQSRRERAAGVPSSWPAKESTELPPASGDIEMGDTSKDTIGNATRPFAHLGGGSAPVSPDVPKDSGTPGSADANDAAAATSAAGSGSYNVSGGLGNGLGNGGMFKFRNTINLSSLFHSTDTNQSATNDQSSSKYVRNTIPIHPATIDTSQMLILRYLTSMGEYQEFLGNVFEQNAMQLIYGYIGPVEQRDTCLAFEALKYLASLLCHKKCALEFITHGGLERLISVPRPSIASTGVSIAMYYLAYCEDAMERICQMPQRFVADVVEYAMWLLGSSHDSGRCHATMFFGLAFQFKVILDEFDRQDGLRKLFNVIAVLPILGTEDHNLNDDEECSARQLVRHVCMALKKYMESHLFYKYTQITRLNTPSEQQTPSHFIPRSPKYTPEMLSEQVRALQELLPYKVRWEPVEKIMFLNLISLLLRIIAYSYEWNYSGRAETARSALDVLIICCIIPKVHLVFCERMDLPEEGSSAGINIILGAAEGEIVADAEVQKAALAVLVHIVCAPIVKPQSISRYGSARKKASNKHIEEMINQCWESVRNNNGIIVLLQLMETKTPITDADCIRGMACRALAGLARSDTVRQIISKLPLFNNGQLQALMRDPILQEKRTEHVQFQKYAMEVMERVTGRVQANNQLDASLANIHRANVVAHTKIQFNEQQLHELIHEHLLARGLTESAQTLQREAGLQAKVAPPKATVHHHSPFAFRSPITSVGSRSRQRHRLMMSDFNATLNAVEPVNEKEVAANEEAAASTGSAAAGAAAVVATAVAAAAEAIVAINTPIKLIKKSHANTPQSLPGTSSAAAATAAACAQQQRSLQKQISAVDTFAPASAVIRPGAVPAAEAAANKSNISLDTIITEYLTNQHALCQNPMSTCPQFDLFVPHKCPDPRPNKVSGHSANFAGRFFRRQGGTSSRRLDRRLVHSNFCVARTLRSPLETDCFFTACDFTPCASSLVVGSYSGEVRVFNINDCVEEFAFTCHESYVNNVQCNREGNLVLTSSSWLAPLSALWNIENKTFTLKLQWDEEDYMEFSNVTQDRLLATKAELATIYDLTTGKKISTFEPEIFNQYSRNRATFCPTDELILSDGVLWDVRARDALHKFDKLNQTLNGVFHPNGLEVVSNTEVWDLRTFHLLRTVPALDQCRVLFSPQNVIYGVYGTEFENQMDVDVGRNYDSSFKTLDAYDFSSIATMDVKRNIYDLAVNKYGSQIAIVENQGGYESIQESVVRVYGVGRMKNVEDEADDDENDMEMSDEESATENMYGLRGGDRESRRRRIRNAFMIPDSDEDVSSSSSSTSMSDVDFMAQFQSDEDEGPPTNRRNDRVGLNEDDEDEDDDDDEDDEVDDDDDGGVNSDQFDRAAGDAVVARMVAAAVQAGLPVPQLARRGRNVARRGGLRNVTNTIGRVRHHGTSRRSVGPGADRPSSSSEDDDAPTTNPRRGRSAAALAATTAATTAALAATTAATTAPAPGTATTSPNATEEPPPAEDEAMWVTDSDENEND